MLGWGEAQNVVHDRHMYLEHQLLVLVALYLVETQKSIEQGVAIVGNVLVIVRDHMFEGLVLFPFDRLDHVSLIGSLKEKAATLASTVFREHQLELFKKSSLEGLGADRLHECIVFNPPNPSDALKHIGEIVLEFASVKRVGIRTL